MEHTREILGMQDIKILVDSFYTLVRQDNLIGPIFNKVIGNKWTIHLERMCHFWQTVLLKDHSYNGNPFPPHAFLEINQLHFNRWLELWNSTLDSYFHGEVAHIAKWRADKMALMFRSKIEYYRLVKSKPLL